MTRLRLAPMLVPALIPCVELPAPAEEPSFATADAAVGIALGIDAGTDLRPPTGAPYTGPECDVPADPMLDPSEPEPDAGAGTPAAGAGAQGTEVADAGAPVDAGAPPDVESPYRRPAPGEIVISEIMVDPQAVRDDVGEWFELHNPSPDETLDLAGCAIDDGAATPKLLSGALVIEPGGYLVVARSAQAGVTAAAQLSFSLGNSGDVLALHCDGLKIDRVAYGSGFPLVAGASMSLDPGALDALSNDDASAWCAAQIAYGPADRGSPGQHNPACAAGDAGAAP